LSIGDQLREINANALPGVTRPEEGESSPAPPFSRSPAPPVVNMSNGYSHPTYNSYEDRERQQNYDRYESYLDERDNEQLPNAFDLGWKRNFLHVFGPRPLLWFVPLVTTTGDGWSWEPSPKWLAACERIKQARENEERIQKQRERAAGWGVDSPTETEFRRTGRAPEGWPVTRHSPPTPRVLRRPEWQAPRRHGEEARYLTTSNGIVNTPIEGRRSPSKADQILGRESGMYADGGDAMQMQPIDRRKYDEYNYISDDEDGDGAEYDVSSDEAGAEEQRRMQRIKPVPLPKITHNWNDIPDDFLHGAPAGKPRKSPSPVSNQELRKDESRERKTSAKAKRKEEWDDWGQDG
jgi:hypothetical protein